MSTLSLIILFPLLGFVILAFSCGRFSERGASFVGAGSIGIAVIFCAVAMFTLGPVKEVLPTGEAVGWLAPLWTWIDVPVQEGYRFTVEAALYLDGLSLTMISVVVGVGFLIHLFASWYMRGEEGFSRFFAYTNLFIAFMLVLVLADNLLLIYLGWEGVGLCSYLLIGFYYKDPKNGAAAMKAFIVTRIGDVFMAIGLFILYTTFGTLNIRELNAIFTQPDIVSEHASAIYWAALMLVGGAFGKSAQLPLQTWLADAMAGPTPVSALIHAATMVTAGVYLIARMNGLFLAAPSVLYLVAIVGTLTLVIAGFSALVQTDIKRILAYSTMSQLGYMFLALGVQAWDAAIFHLMTHAFFKALLFLGAGSVIVACHHEQNIFKMGGLRKHLPLTFIAFIVGGSALSALPLLTAGFFSKDEILWGAVVNGHGILAFIALAGAFLTSLYTFRMIFIVFFGAEKLSTHRVGGLAHNLPLMVLIVLSTFVGALITPPLGQVLPHLPEGMGGEMFLAGVSGIVAIAGVFAAWLMYRRHKWFESASLPQGNAGEGLMHLWYNGWGFDWLYDKVFVRPYLKIARCLQCEPLDKLVNILGWTARLGHVLLAFTQNGQIRWYAACMCAGAVAVLGIMLTAWQ